MASFGHQAYTFSSGTGSKTVYLKWIKANHRDIQIVYTGWKTVYNYTNSLPTASRLYGINGTFYDSPGTSLMISMYNSNPGVTAATKVWSTSDRNLGSMPKETLICLDHSTSAIPQFIFTASFSGYLSNYLYNGTTPLDMTNVRWAMAGFALKLNETISESDYNYYLEHVQGATNAQITASRTRTAMFYIGGTASSENIVLLTAFADQNVYHNNQQLSANGSVFTMYELRSCIKSVFPTATHHGIILDGGASTGITYTVSTHTGTCAQMVNDNGSARTTPTMVVAPM